jgi:hypothetical protein
MSPKNPLESDAAMPFIPVEPISEFVPYQAIATPSTIKKSIELSDIAT